MSDPARQTALTGFASSGGKETAFAGPSEAGILIHQATGPGQPG